MNDREVLPRLSAEIIVLRTLIVALCKSNGMTKDFVDQLLTALQCEVEEWETPTNFPRGSLILLTRILRVI